MEVAFVELGHGIPRCRRSLEKGALSDFPLDKDSPLWLAQLCPEGFRGISSRLTLNRYLKAPQAVAEDPVCRKNLKVR